jgi:hypothetical protein
VAKKQLKQPMTKTPFRANALREWRIIIHSLFLSIKNLLQKDLHFTGKSEEELSRKAYNIGKRSQEIHQPFSNIFHNISMQQKTSIP